jgi:hypothetical protein
MGLEFAPCDLVFSFGSLESITEDKMFIRPMPAEAGLET